MAYAKDGEPERVTWDKAFDVMAEQFKRAQGKGAHRRRHVRLRQWTIWEGYGPEADEGGLRRTTWIRMRHCMASAAVGFAQLRHG
jgi:nitrate reductase NapA